MCRFERRLWPGFVALTIGGVFIATSVYATSPDLPIVIDPRYVGPPASANQDTTNGERVVSFLPKVKLEVAMEAAPCNEGIVSCLANSFSDTRRQPSAATPSGALLLFFPIVSMNPTQASDSLPRDRQFFAYRHFNNSNNRIPAALSTVEDPESNAKGKPLLIVAEDVEGEPLNKANNFKNKKRDGDAGKSAYSGKYDVSRVRHNTDAKADKGPVPTIGSAKKENEHTDTSVVRPFIHRRNDLLLSEEPVRSGWDVNRYVLGVKKTPHNANKKKPNTSGHPQEVLDLVPAETSDIHQKKNVTKQPVFGTAVRAMQMQPNTSTARSGSNGAPLGLRLNQGPYGAPASNKENKASPSKKSAFELSEFTVKGENSTNTGTVGGPSFVEPLAGNNPQSSIAPRNTGRDRASALESFTLGHAKLPARSEPQINQHPAKNQRALQLKGSKPVRDSAAGAGEGKVNVQDLYFTHRVDKTAPSLEKGRSATPGSEQLSLQQSEPNLTCKRGKVKKGKCECPPRMRLVRIRENYYNCTAARSPR